MSSPSGRSLFKRHRVLLLAIALAVKAAYIAIAVVEIKQPETPGWFNIQSGDTAGYLDPIESVLDGGSYTPDYRMPGVGAPYWILRQFLDVPSSRDAVVVLQWLLSALSVYLLGLLATRISGSERTGLAVYVLFLLSAYASWYDAYLSSDSFSTSIIIIGAYLLQRAVDRTDLWTLALAGAALTWLIFLRPVYAALLPVAIVLLYRHAKWPRPTMALLVFILPFALTDSWWALRNWRANHTFSPLTNQGLMPTDLMSGVTGHAMSFLQCYGGFYIWWDPGAEIRWYGIWKGGAGLDDEGRRASPPPDYAIVPGYTLDSLYILSERVRSLRDRAPADSLAELARINAKFDHYAELYKQQAPFNYHVMSRLRMLRNQVRQHGAESIIVRPFSELPWWLKLFKASQSFFYLFAYTTGTVAVVILLWNWKKAPTLLHLWTPMVVAFTTLIYPIVLRMCEWRYMVHQFPMALMLGVCLLASLATRLRAQRSQAVVR